MKVLIYGINYSPELTGIGKYSGEMARWLASQGHDVHVVTAPPYYPEWRVRQGFRGLRWRFEYDEGVRVLRCPLYVPSQPSSLTRLLHLLSFSLSSFLPLLLQFFWRPRLVVLVVPTLFCAPQAILLARLCGAKSVLHVQDYEVDAMFGLGLGKGRGLRRLALAMERFILRRFDRVSTISPGMVQRARDKGVDDIRLRLFPNWSEVSRFRGVRRSQAMLQRLSVPLGKKVILYAGNIGNKQGLETLVEVAAQLRECRDLMFLLVGEGAGKAVLVESVQARGLENVVFAPLQSYDELPTLLASADVHLVIQKRGAADAVLPSKLTNILAVGGNAVITADPDTSLGQLCSDYPGIAVLVEPESVVALRTGIETALAMPSPNEVAAGYAAGFLDKDAILARFLREL